MPCARNRSSRPPHRSYTFKQRYQDVIEYLREANRIIRERLGDVGIPTGDLLFSNEDRALLADFARRVYDTENLKKIGWVIAEGRSPGV